MHRVERSEDATGGEGYLRISGVSKSYRGVTALEPFSLEVSQGDFIVLVGPSGCGKSTALRLIAGLETPDAGTISLAGTDITCEDPARRDIAMVFQDYALYPHLTAYENIAFPLRARRRPRREIAAEVERAAAAVGIEGLLGRRPAKLSGGQRQRVAIARALVRKPALFLMDEPLSNLDAKLRSQMRGELARLHAETGATVVYVTHDQTEALSLATKVVVLKDGRVQQVGAPQDLYGDPANVFVAGFVGMPPMNLMHGVISEGCVSLGPDGGGASGESAVAVVVGVRPDSMRLIGADEAASVTLGAVVDRVEFAGARCLVFAQTAGGSLVFEVPDAGREGLSAGMSIRVTFDPAAAFLFDEATGCRL